MPAAWQARGGPLARGCRPARSRDVLIEPDTRLDPRQWGPFTVAKPLAGRQGEGVRLRRTVDVRWIDPRSGPIDDPRFGQTILAQRFIDTGPFAQSHRVLVVLSRAVFSILSRQLKARPAIDPDSDEAVDLPIASNAGERRIDLNFDDVIKLACRTARAFPNIPVLGIDVVREAATGDLHILEVNAAGCAWQLSSDCGEIPKKKHNLDVAGQFGALAIIADALIEVTRARSRVGKTDPRYPLISPRVPSSLPLGEAMADGCLACSLCVLVVCVVVARGQQVR